MQPRKDVLLYVLVPAWSKSARPDLKELLASGDAASIGGLFEPVITHELNNPGEDPIINRIRQLGFASESTEAKVHVIYVPCYLNGDDGILDMNYYDMLAGLDLTAFPSYYEPWGYTPLESVAFGVPTITTTLSGFGQWVLSLGKNGFSECGVVVVNRNDSNYQQVVGEMAGEMLALSNAPAATIAADSVAARETADKAEWSYFITYYVDAFRMALAAADKRRTEQAG
jgi:glycosyltransferase involved in cell wall biosynthesis